MQLASICAILAIAAHNDWEINTFDFNGAYLSGELNDDEDIYMQSSLEYENEGEFIKHLHKSLYSLKQAGHKWYDTLCCTLADLGFHISDADPGVFYTYNGDNITMLAIYIDNCLITGTSCYNPDSRGPLLLFLLCPLSFSHPFPHMYFYSHYFLGLPYPFVVSFLPL